MSGRPAHPALLAVAAASLAAFVAHAGPPPAHIGAPIAPTQPGTPGIPGSTGAGAVSSVSGIATSGGLLPVDQGFADLDPLSASLRYLHLGYRQELGFERLFEVPGHPDLLMRRDGAITAIFPRSRYEETEDGVVALIPDGAIFHIGPLDDAVIATITGRRPAAIGAAAAGRRLHGSTRAGVAGRVSSMMSPMQVDRPDRETGPVVFPTFLSPPAMAPVVGAGHEGQEAEIEAPAIWNNEVYRRSRLQSLLRDAARADRP